MPGVWRPTVRPWTCSRTTRCSTRAGWSGRRYCDRARYAGSLRARAARTSIWGSRVFSLCDDPILQDGVVSMDVKEARDRVTEVFGLSELESGAYAGDWLPTAGRTVLESHSPIDGGLLGRVTLASESDYDQVA